MKAPTSKSFLSKAYDFFRSKTSKDEHFYTKPKNLFSDDIYPVLCEPIDSNRIASPSRKHKQVLQEINGSNFVNQDRGIRGHREGRATSVKNYWSSWGLKKINTENRQESNNGEWREEEEEEEGVFTIQLIKPQSGYLGIVLVGGADTPLENHYVYDILPSSSASKSGRARIGDELLEANDHTLRGKTHAEALMIFRTLPTVVKLVVARTRHANRPILDRVHKKRNERVNNNIATPEKRRSVIEEAAKTSVVPRTLSSVIDVTKKACPYVKPVTRASRVSSFVGSVENVLTNDRDLKTRNEEKPDENAVRRAVDNRYEDDKVVYTLSDKPDNEDYAVFHGGTQTPDSMSLTSSSPCQSIFDLPQIDEDETLRFSSVALRRSRTINGSLKRRSVIERCDAAATWPSVTTKQRASLAWDSFIPPKPASIKRSSSARSRRHVVPTSAPSASNMSLHQSSPSARKQTGKHYIERRTIVVELQRQHPGDDWGFTIGGGVCSPYGDLPIFIVNVSNNGMANGVVQSGDEVADVSGDSFEGVTFLEAEKILRSCAKTKVTVTLKRKFLQRSQSPQSNPYAAAWSSTDSPNVAAARERRRPKSMQC